MTKTYIVLHIKDEKSPSHLHTRRLYKDGLAILDNHLAVLL